LRTCHTERESLLSRLSACAGKAAIDSEMWSHQIEASVPVDAIDRPSPIHGCSRAYGFTGNGPRNRPWPQHDAGPHDAAGGITDVLAVHDGNSLLGAGGYESRNQDGSCKYHVSFVFIAIPPIEESADSTTDERPFAKFSDPPPVYRRMFDSGPTITRLRRTADGEATSYFASFIFAMTSSKLKLAAFCRCGYSRNDARN
jgi:hypothetical protein